MRDGGLEGGWRPSCAADILDACRAPEEECGGCEGMCAREEGRSEKEGMDENRRRRWVSEWREEVLLMGDGVSEEEGEGMAGAAESGGWREK